MDKSEEYSERGLLKPELKKDIYSKYANKCYVCNYSIVPALRVHHIIPREFGGNNNFENFVLLCSNCHTLVHFFSSTKYQNKEIKKYIEPQLNEDAINRLKELTIKAQNARQKIMENGNLWVASKPYTVNEAVEIMSVRNKLDDIESNLLSQVIKKVLQNMPSTVCGACSFRLLKDGKYLSVNLDNYLLFRTPGYGDFAEKPQFDCLMTFPKDKVPDKLKPIENRDVWLFSHLDCVNVGLSFSEALKLDEADWSLFKDACQMAQSARKTRTWISNIDINTLKLS